MEQIMYPAHEQIPLNDWSHRFHLRCACAQDSLSRLLILFISVGLSHSESEPGIDNYRETFKIPSLKLIEVPINLGLT